MSSKPEPHARPRKVICMWSGPRNLSTAMMRSFGARADTAVWDEPFFAPYLAITGKDHPGRAETLARHETDPYIVAEQMRHIPEHAHYMFQKHMPHHMLDTIPREWMDSAVHFFLLRDPARVIASYAKGRADFDVTDLGFSAQRQLFDTLAQDHRAPPPIIDSADILRHPERALTQLCAAIDIPFDPAMLSWLAGPRPEDGAWGPYWYKSVWASTGFAPPSIHESALIDPALTDKEQPYLDACQDDYAALYQHRLMI